MGLDMNLYKLNKKVVDMQDLIDSISEANEAETKKRLLAIFKDYSTLSLPEFFLKNQFNSYLRRYKESATNKVLRTKLVEEVSDYIKDIKERLDSMDEVDFNLVLTELCYWSKHSDLNGMFEQMYHDRGGVDVFNCKDLVLSKDDIIDIIEKHKEHLDGVNEIPQSSGFFWGQTVLEDWKNSLVDFERVLKETDWDNETVFYNCWW